MTSLLVGQDIADELFEVSKNLKNATRAGFVEKFGLGGSCYTPWMCMYPVINTAPPTDLLHMPFCEPGGLVSEPGYLVTARDFVAMHPRLNNDGIFDDKPEYWLPDPNVSQAQQAAFVAGRKLLLSTSASLTRLYFELVDFVIPLPGTKKNRGYSSSLLRGAIFRTIPEESTPADIAIDLVHELGHQVLQKWQSVDPIITSDPNAPIYSEIRRTLRPAIQTFHAAVALAYMHLFVESMKLDEECAAAGKRRGALYTDDLRTSLLLSTSSLRQKCAFSKAGARMLDEMEALA